MQKGKTVQIKNISNNAALVNATLESGFAKLYRIDFLKQT